MLRIDIILSKDDKVSSQMISLLQAETEKRIHELYPDAIIRVRTSSSKMINISGTKDGEKDEVLRIIEDIFYSDDWLP